jgi:hypothetical protein
MNERDYNHFLRLKKYKAEAEESIIKNSAKGYPNLHSSSGSIRKFIPYILATKVGGIRITVTTVNILMILFCINTKMVKNLQACQFIFVHLD